MDFQVEKAAQSVEAQAENRLDLNTVCPDRAAAEYYKVGRTDKNIDVQELLAMNDHVVALASNQWNSIITKFNSLPDSYKQELVQSFAPHMIGDEENYPMYNRLVKTHSQAPERGTMTA
jgi:hypothetical protein